MRRGNKPTILVIFGITGDLAQRKLLPALYRLLVHDQIDPQKIRIVGVSRRDVTVKSVIAGLKDSGEYQSDQVRKFGKLLQMVQMDLLDDQDYAKLKNTLGDIAKQWEVPSQQLFYLSMPPQAYGSVIEGLSSAGMNDASSAILVEKPFGYDLASARDLIRRTNRCFREDQIFRIDHYLAKETAQNILAFRLHNPLFGNIWNGKHICKIVITAAEQIGIEGRSTFYEQTGALRDLIQSHLLQLLALVTMEEPRQLNATSIRRAKLQLLRAIPPIKPNQVTERAVRGQYEGYHQESGNPHSTIETFAAIRLEIDNDRWRGVPVILQSGKAMSQKSTDIQLIFRDQQTRQITDNTLSIKLQPDEGIGLDILAKAPGLGNDLQRVEMDFRYARSFESRQPEAYERVLMDAIRGDQTLFAGSQEVEVTWQIIEAVVHSWQESPQLPHAYLRGSDIFKLSDSLTKV